MVLDKSFIKKSSKEKRAMEPTINNTGWNSEFFNTLSLVRALTVNGVEIEVSFGYTLFEEVFLAIIDPDRLFAFRIVPGL